MIELSGLFYRVMFAGADDPTAPVDSPEGRFHHGRQRALYASQSVEGAVVAMHSYLTDSDPPREVHPLALTAGRIVDLTNPDDVARDRLDASVANLRWQDERNAGRRPATWALGDAVRRTGADGMLNASRQRPDLCHLVLFRWNAPGAPGLRPAGPALPFKR